VILPIPTDETFASLPPVWPEDFLPRLRSLVGRQKRKIVVLDDDPTGTQTVHETTILTKWSEARFFEEFQNPEPIVYLLTNSRAMPTAEAATLSIRCGDLIARASKETGRPYIAISRSDSTLRGHYPAEVDALAVGLRFEHAVHILIPAFFAGGRFTIGDTHYVREGDTLVPAADTEFAQDATFGYRSSNLFDWVEEKSGGRVRREKIRSISIENLRTGGPERVGKQLSQLQPGTVLIVNAAAPEDLDVFGTSLLESIDEMPNLVLRSAASIVPVLGALARRPVLEGKDVSTVIEEGSGGLVVVGSYVGKTTRQVSELLKLAGVVSIELDVERILRSTDTGAYLAEISARIDRHLSEGKTLVIYTSRKLVRSDDPDESLRIGRRVADALNAVIEGVTVRPRFLVAKGGITSSEVAQNSLTTETARVVGQIAPGVPFWTLKEGARFADLPYVVFPGNVGTDRTLAEVVANLRHGAPRTPEAHSQNPASGME
jgi:uncharacterized protein YgbK (DUF1537 family)